MRSPRSCADLVRISARFNGGSSSSRSPDAETTLDGATAALPFIVCAYAIPYLLRARTLAAQGRPVPRIRQASFLAGLAVLVGANVPPLSTLAGDDFSAHMVEHLLIADVAALL